MRPSRRASRWPRSVCGVGSRGRASTVTDAGSCTRERRGSSRARAGRSFRPPGSRSRSRLRSARCAGGIRAGVLAACMPSWGGPDRGAGGLDDPPGAAAQPPGRPAAPRRRKARTRFERESANDLWQIDATEVGLADGSRAWVVDCLDDHARFLRSALACAGPGGEAAWACFARAGAAHGLPRQLLSDNHVSFTGRLFGFEVAFERRLRQVGVELINAAPAHPQTLGKLERFHRTLKEWLADEGPLPSRRAARPARPLPGVLQPGAPPPGDRRSDASRALPPSRHARCAAGRPGPLRGPRARLPAPARSAARWRRTASSPTRATTSTSAPASPAPGCGSSRWASSSTSTTATSSCAHLRPTGAGATKQANEQGGHERRSVESASRKSPQRGFTDVSGTNTRQPHRHAEVAAGTPSLP